MSEALEPGFADWIVLMTHRHSEDLALANLKHQSFSAYCPMVLRQVRHARRTSNARRPLFPGYVFMQMPSPPHRLRHVLSTIGVRQIVTAGEKPAKLPAGFVESLQAREEGGCISKLEISFQPGQHVMINGGAFDGLIAQVLELKEHNRVLVLLGILNRETRVDIGVRDLV